MPWRAVCRKCNYIMFSCSKLLLTSSIYKHLKRCRYSPTIADIDVKVITKAEYTYLTKQKKNRDFWITVKRCITMVIS